MELKKSYKGFVWFMAGFIAALTAVCFFPTEDEGLLTRLICNLSTCGVALLAWIVYRTENVYWYNGTEYDEAVAAGSERRKLFARRHLDRFAACAAGCLLYSLAAQALGWPWWIDMVLCFGALVGAAVSTIGIKL